MGWMTKSCRAALSKPLEPPPFLPKAYRGDRVKRWDEGDVLVIDTLAGSILLPWWRLRVAFAMLLTASPILCCVLTVVVGCILFWGRRIPQRPMPRPGPETWIASSIPRPEKGPSIGNVRKRIVKSVADEDQNSEGVWEPAGVSVARIEGDLLCSGSWSHGWPGYEAYE